MKKISFYLPLSLTLSRIIITPFILFFLCKNSVQGFLLGLILFLYGLASDFLDGFCARRYDAETALGRFLDPLADKLLLWPLLGYLYWHALLPLSLLFIFIVRDVLITLLRIYAQKNQIPFTTSWWAKRKTALQFGMIFLGIFLLLAQKSGFPHLIKESLRFSLHATTALALGSSLISAFLYLQQFQSKFGLWGLYFISTVAGVGFIPFMPGTWGSLIGVLSYVYLIPTEKLPLVLLGLTVIGISTSTDLCTQLKVKDPKFIVIDEVVGFLSAAALIMPQTPYEIGLLFVLFRCFDILKPWPIYLFEQLPGGRGIIADDLAAGAAAAGLFWIIAFLQPFLTSSF